MRRLHNDQRPTRHGIAAVGAQGGDAKPWQPIRHLGGFDATFVPAGTTLSVFSYNDAALATFEPPASG